MYIYEIQRWRYDEEGSIVLDDRAFAITQDIARKWCQDDARPVELVWLSPGTSGLPEDQAEKVGMTDQSCSSVREGGPFYVIHRHTVVYVAP